MLRFGTNSPTPPTPRVLTRAEAREIDRHAIEDLGVPGVVLMENAGRGAADVVKQMLAARRPAGRRVAVLCGGGNNGGDGYVIARHLHNAGVTVTVHPAIDPGDLKGDALINATIAARMKLPFEFIRDDDELAKCSWQWDEADVIVDALLGTGFRGKEVRPPIAGAIRRCNAARSDRAVRSLCAEVLAVDLPSGLDCDTGQPAEPTIVAHVTVTFVGPKVGFAQPGAAKFLGRVVVAGIGV